MNALQPPRQLRLIIETEDFDTTVGFYRDVLGMPEQAAFAAGGEDRVAILHAGIATLEIASPQHARMIDEVEGAPPGAAGALRLALEVDDTRAATAVAREAGAPELAEPVETPFRTLSARVRGPAGWQVTFFEELETLEERCTRDGFSVDGARGPRTS